MSESVDLEKRLLAAALFELRVLLSSHINPEDKSPVGTAAWFAYFLHNQAAATLAGQPFDVAAAIDGLSRLEPELGPEHLQHFRRVVLDEA